MAPIGTPVSPITVYLSVNSQLTTQKLKNREIVGGLARGRWNLFAELNLGYQKVGNHAN